jgi:hypothetical protein
MQVRHGLKLFNISKKCLSLVESRHNGRMSNDRLIFPFSVDDFCLMNNKKRPFVFVS